MARLIRAKSLPAMLFLLEKKGRVPGGDPKPGLT
jgi:hypothetical protein